MKRFETVFREDGSTHKQWFLTEDGLYEVLMQSRKQNTSIFYQKKGYANFTYPWRKPSSFNEPAISKAWVSPTRSFKSIKSTLSLKR